MLRLIFLSFLLYTRPLNEVMEEAQAQGHGVDVINSICDQWMAAANLKRYPEAVAEAIAALPEAER